MRTLASRLHALELKRLLLNEAVGREAHADALAELVVHAPDLVLGPTVRRLVHAQRIRAMALRGQAAALALASGTANARR